MAGESWTWRTLALLLAILVTACGMVEVDSLTEVTDRALEQNQQFSEGQRFNRLIRLRFLSDKGFVVRPGFTLTLKVRAEYADGGTSDVTRKCRFLVLDPAIATINASGTLTGLKEGSTTLAGYFGSDRTESQNLLVSPFQVNSIAIKSDKVALGAGEKIQLVASGTFDDGSRAIITSLVSWKSSNTAVGAIDNAGLFTAYSTGSTAVSASVGSVTSNILTFTIAGGANPGDIIINEVVTDPQQDWSDTKDGDGKPFNAVVGSEVAGSDDEWVELYNRASGTISLRGWKLVMKDTSDATVEFGTSKAILSFSNASGSVDAFPGGSYLAIGDPDGTMNNDVYLQLLDKSGNLIDDVEIGDDPENDEPDDGAPDSGKDGNASGKSDEAVARIPNASDTDNDVKDFDMALATIATANPGGGSGIGEQGIASGGEVLINEVCTDPQSDWSDSTGGNNVPFDSTPGLGTPDSADEYVELKNNSTRAINLSGFVLRLVDTTAATETLGLGDATIAFSSGSTLTALQPGGYAVLGDPAGTMNLDVWVRLYDSQGTLIDQVEIGSDVEADGDDGAPAGGSTDGNANSVSDESIARIPDGRDTANDINDFAKFKGTPLANNGNGVISITITPTIASFTSGTKSFHASATMISGGTINATAKVDWISSATTVFTVNSSGVVSFVAPGGGKLRAASGTVTASATVIALANTMITITEVVTDPQRDWDESSGAGDGISYNATPGPGAPAPADEYIEIKNMTGQNINLTGWVLQLIDSTPATHSFSVPGTAVHRFSLGGSVPAFKPGELLVIGHPGGGAVQINNDCYIVLRNPPASGSQIIDKVEIGDDFEQDGNADGAPDGGTSDGNATATTDESVSRVYVDQDTNNDIVDFQKTTGTPTQPNPN